MADKKDVNKVKSRAGSMGGKASAAARWGDKDPATIRSKRISLVISELELDMIDSKAKQDEISRTELVIRAVSVYKTKEQE